VAALGMEGHFSASNAFAVDQHAKDAKRTKVDVLKEYLISKPFDELVVIGDSPSDMVLAETVGARGYLYAHVGTPFREANAYHKTHDLRDVLAEL